MKINLINFIVLSIAFAIGVDYGVNIFQRNMQDGMDSTAWAVGNTGGAVPLAGPTTILCYGSLLIACNPAFVSLGRLAVLGKITFSIAALGSLPGYRAWKAEKRGRNKPAIGGAGGRSE